MTRIAHVSTGDLAAQNIAALIAGRLDERQIIVDDCLAYGPLRDVHTAAGLARRIVANQDEGARRLSFRVGKDRLAGLNTPEAIRVQWMMQMAKFCSEPDPACLRTPPKLT